MSQTLYHQHITTSITETNSDATATAHETSTHWGTGIPSATKIPPPNAPNGKKRRSSKMKSTKHLSRSTSTPQMRDPIMSESEIDKKRNKLGYQRISIACAHCRRRKIRCLVAEGDPQQRCQNCIRLKKDCVFYPVEQQTAMENRSQPSNTSGADSGPSSVVSSSPPTSGNERPFEQPHPASPFHTLPSNVPASFQSLPLAPGSALPAQGSFAPPDHSYRPSDDPRMVWNSAEHYNHVSPDHLPVMASTSHDVWRYNHLRAPGDFAPFPSESPQLPRPPPQYAQNAHAVPFTEHRDSQQWQHIPPPSRSMSYGNVEGMQANRAYYAPPFQPDFRATQAPLQQPPAALDMNAPMMAHGIGPRSAPVGLPPYAQRSPYAFSADPNSVSSAPFPPHPSYSGNWYSDPSSFGPLEEEPDHVEYPGRSHPAGQ